MSYVVFHKGDTAEIEQIPVEDGNIIFDTEENKIFVDDDNERKQYGGTIDVDDELNVNSDNPIANSAVATKFNTQDTNIDNISNRLISNGIPFKFGVDSNGNYGYYKVGADTVTPFKTGYKIYKRKFNSNEAIWKQPKNSSGNVTNAVGKLGNTSWTYLCNGSYKYDKGFTLPLTDFEDLDYIFDNPTKIKSVQVLLYPTVNPTSYDQYGEMREPFPNSVYNYTPYFEWFKPSTYWTKNTSQNRLQGYVSPLRKNTENYTPSGMYLYIYNGDDARIVLSDLTEQYWLYQFKYYLGYELTIIYE